MQVVDIRGIFLLSLIPSAIAVLILIFFVKEGVVKRSSSRVSMISNINRIIRDNRPFLLLLTITGIFGIGAFNFPSILLQASDLGIAEKYIPLIYSTLKVTHIAIGIASDVLAVKVGKEKCR